MSHATTSSSTASEAASRLEAERWTCVAIMAVGVVLGLIGLVQELGSVLMWVGVGVIVLGLIVGAVLKGMGMGYEGEVRKHERGELKH